MGFIRVARLGEKVETVEISAGEKVGDYFAEELAKGDHEIRVNGTTADKDTPLKEEDVVTMVPNIRAGR